MKGSAEVVRTLIVFAVVSGCLANKPKKLFKKYPPPQQRNGGAPFLPLLKGPIVPPFALSPMEQPNADAPPTDPYACLPKYLCVVKNKKGEKRTTIVHGLHPALRKAKPDVIDPASFQTGGTKNFPRPSISDPTDDDIFREREFDDSFLKQQEAVETMAFVEEKRRQYLYQQRQPTQVVLPKGKPPKKPVESKESVEEEKSQEASKEEKEEVEKSVEEKEEVEKSVEEKEEPESVEEEEPESAETNVQTGPKLDKYKIKKKAYANKLRSNAFKSRMDDYEETDDADGHLATVPWDDRVSNDSNPLKPKEIYDKLFGKVLPFQLSLPKIAKSIPGMSFLASDDDVTTTTTTAKPGLFKRMLKAVTGSGDSPTPPTMRQRFGAPMHRYKRDTAENFKYVTVTEDMKIVKQIRDPARQCRMIYKGCDLPYEHIMKMVSAGQVLIENDNVDDDAPVTKKPVPANPTSVQDDEAEQALRDRVVHKTAKPIPQLLAQAHLGGKKKVVTFGKNKKPVYQESEEVGSTEAFLGPKPKKVASLPILPMRYHWGKPSYTVHGKPSYSEGPAAFSGGVLDKAFSRTTPPPKPTAPTTTTTERPIFAAAPLDKKDNLTAPTFQHSVIKLNKTHAVHVLKKKAYNPAKTRTRDEKGRPVSFSTVFSEIAGHSGGIHDFFDRISGAFGGDELKESGRELSGPFPGPPKRGNSDRGGPMAKPTAFPQAPIPPDHIEKEDDDGNSAERDDEMDASDEEDDGEEQDEEDEGNDEDEDEEEDDVGPRPYPPMKVQKYKPEGPPTPTGDPQSVKLENVPPPLGGGNSEEEVYTLDVPQDKNKERPGRPGKPGDENDDEEEDNRKKRPGRPGRPEEAEDEEDNDDEEEDNKKKKKRPGKPGKPDEPEDEEGNDEEEDEEELDLPDTIPEFIRESMIKEHEKKKLEKQQGGGEDEEEEDDQQQDGPPGQQQGGPPGGRPGGYGGPPSQGGGVLSSLFGSSQQGPPKQGGGMFGSSQGPPKKGGGMFSFLG